MEKSEQQFTGRSYRLYDKQVFMDNLSARSWGSFYNADDPTQAWQEMLDIFMQEAEKMCPVRQYTIRNSKPPWLTNELIEQMKDRDYFYCKAKRTNNEDDWNIAKFHRNQVNFNIRKAKADFVKEQLRNNEGNSARFWRTIKQIMPTKKGAKNNNSKITLQDIPSGPSHKDELAEHMNTFFANIGKSTENTTHPENAEHNPPKIPDECDPHPDNILDFSPVSNFEVELKRINISKSSGINLLSSKLLKDGFQAISDKLTYLFNFSIRVNIFPAQWKKALVIPIPKISNPKMKEDYRPISLLPLPGKLLEKLAHTQLTLFLEDNALLSDNQFGFRKQRSTVHAISTLLNQIYSNINRSVITAVVNIDFSKAFNCVQHSILLEKLKRLNLHDNIIKWIASYLEDREQRTLVNNTLSSFLPVNQGVPQGSVLGPLLYIIYSNDFADKIKNSGFAFYADDTVLFSKKKNLTQACADLQIDLDNLTDWCTQNKIYMNNSKTKSMFFGSKVKINSTELPTFQIDSTDIVRAKTYSYLGIKLDEQLSMETQASSLIKKVSNKIYQLTRIRSFITKRAALLIYKNMILAILEYGDIFLHSATQRIRSKLQKLQNKALRCALNKDRLTKSTVLHEEAKLLKLKDRRHIHILLHMYQLSQLPNFKLWKTYRASGVRTRSSKKKLLTSRRPTNEKYRKSITYQGPKLWNSLPGETQKLGTYHEFKKIVTSMFQENLKQLQISRSQTQTQTQTQVQTNTKLKNQKSKPKPKPKPMPKPKPKPKSNLKPKPKPKPNQNLKPKT